MWNFIFLHVLWPWITLKGRINVNLFSNSCIFKMVLPCLIVTRESRRLTVKECLRMLNVKFCTHWKLYFECFTVKYNLRSKVMRGNESSHMTSYLLVIVYMWLGSTVLKRQVFKNIVSLIWPFKVIQGQRTWRKMKFHIWLPICC